MYIPSKSMDGVELSATQYNRLIELATADGRLADTIASYGKMPSIQSKAEQDLGAVQAMITQEISESYTRARDMLVAEDPDLAEKVRDVVEARREYGKYKR
jgi:hypothetical protein